MSVDDANMILKYLAGKIKLSTAQFAAADFNQDGSVGSVDKKDATLIIKQLQVDTAKTRIRNLNLLDIRNLCATCTNTGSAGNLTWHYKGLFFHNYTHSFRFAQAQKAIKILCRACYSVFGHTGTLQSTGR